MPMKVRALRDGFYGGSRRREGDTFELQDGHTLGKWMEEVTAKPKAPPADGKHEQPAENYEALLVRAKAHGLTFHTGRPKKEELLKAIKQAEGMKDSQDLA